MLVEGDQDPVLLPGSLQKRQITGIGSYDFRDVVPLLP
jgi:hypothetical protein